MWDGDWVVVVHTGEDENLPYDVEIEEYKTRSEALAAYRRIT